jgi:hypothetical protein
VRICVVGWYFNDSCLKVLAESRHDSFFVCHKEPPKPIHNSIVIPNVGLEFGCYDWFLKNEWKDSDVLFMHDDNEITEDALDLIANLDRDQVYLFTSEQEAKANGHCHGRAMFCSEKFLRKLYVDGGFWFDEGNHGNISATSTTEPNYHNQGIEMFRAYLSSLPKSMTVNRVAIVPGLKCGYRGRL